MAQEWATHVRQWFAMNAPLRSDGAPGRIEEYFIYQNMLGAWPLEDIRLEAYVEKALREAKRNTNWAEVDEDYEARVKAFCRALYTHRPFRESFDRFAGRVAEIAEQSSLAQLLIKLTAPGVADICHISPCIRTSPSSSSSTVVSMPVARTCSSAAISAAS